MFLSFEQLIILNFDRLNERSLSDVSLKSRGGNLLTATEPSSEYITMLHLTSFSECTSAYCDKELVKIYSVRGKLFDREYSTDSLNTYLVVASCLTCFAFAIYFFPNLRSKNIFT